jgi:Tol biopolymer transport system component
LSQDSEGSGIWEIQVDENGFAIAAPEKFHSSAPGSAHYLAGSPAGDRLAFSLIDTRDNLYSIQLTSTGSVSEPLALTQDTRLRKTRPAFSTDGSLIAFLIAQRGRAGQIWTVTPDGKNARQIPLGSKAVDPGWCSGNILCYWSYEDREQTNLWHWDLSEGRPANAFHTTERVSAIRLSPDGKTAAYQKTDNGIMNVWTLSVKDGQARQLTFRHDMAGWPCWSHSGNLLAIEVKDGPNTQVAVVPSSGGTPVPLTHDSGQSWPFSWSPDDEEIVFAGFRSGVWNVYSVSRKTGTQRQFTRYNHVNTFVRYPEWSPTGHQIVYEYGASSSNIWLLEPRRK